MRNKTSSGQRPVNIVAATKSGYQDAIWETVRKLRTFNLKQLICAIDRQYRVNDDTVKSYVQRLERGGYLKIIKREKVNNLIQRFIYELVHDIGVEAPRLTHDGQPTQQGLGREHMWRAMRILGHFDYRELALSASTEACTIREDTAREYCRYLQRAGYLAIVASATHKTLIRYKFVPSKFTGPRPPKIQRVKQLYDPNLRQVVWPTDGGRND